jgi:hypothetical protein
MKKCSEELIKLTENIQSEKKNREESEVAIYDMLRDVVSKVKAEIETERRTRYFLYRKFEVIRESTEETLIGLLEETCNKLNAASHV